MLKTCCALAALWLAIGLLFSAPAFAGEAASVDEPRIVATSWGTDEGLPQGSVISIFQTRSGYLWLGTLNGLVRFDGVRFTVFDEANTPGLTSRRIVHLFEDSRTNFWIGTESDGVVLIQSNGEATQFDFGRGSPGGKVIGMCEDATGSVWMNTADGQLGRYWSNRIDLVSTRIRVAVNDSGGQLWVGTESSLMALEVFADTGAIVLKQAAPISNMDYLLSSREGGLWVLANGEVGKWDGTTPRRRLGPYPWGATRILSACEDQKGNLVVGTGEGVFWYDSAGRARRISSQHGLSHNTILSLAMDREGTLWVGTDGGGLNSIRESDFRVADGTQGFTVQSVSGGREGTMWLATFGGGIGRWQNGTLKDYGRADGLSDLYARSVFMDRQGDIWAGTTVEGLFQLQGDRFEQIPGTRFFGAITAIHEDHEGRLWFGTQTGLLSREANGTNWQTFTFEEATPDAVRAILADGNTVWVGTEQSGLKVLRNGEISSVRKIDGGLPSDTVTALWKDEDGVLWIGTSAGLARWHQDKWTHYTTREGLVSNGIGYLLDDGEGNLWIGTYAGLMRISRKSLNDFANGVTGTIQCRGFGRSDGLPTRECTLGSQPAATRTSDGRLWFSTIKGLVSVNPSDLRPNLFAPPVVIESVRVEGEEMSGNGLTRRSAGSLTVPAGRERIDIQFTSLNLGGADRSRFRYRMDGHETGWTEAGVDRVARYSNLPPGEYEFRVIAANEDGVWNETGAALGITVLPPFWRTWWFIATVTACVIGLIVAGVHYLSTQKLQRELVLLRQQEELERERSRIARDLHDQLGANLTQVAMLGEMAESDRHLPDEVVEHARQISQTARETTKALDEIVWAVNPSNDTLDGLITYVCKYAQEYFELAGLRYRLEAPAELPPTPIPPEVRHNVFLAAKEAVNNIVKHAQASSALLRLRLESGRVTLELQDDGRGIPSSATASGRNGLRNMRKRMEDIGGAFVVEPAAGQGTVVRLTVPIKS